MKKMLPALLCLLQSISILAINTDTLTQEKYSVHFQATIVNQSKYGFTVPYSGINSLSEKYENQTSLTSTLFLGAKTWKNGAIFLNPEIAGGSGLSSALGIADATNGETFRVGDPAPKIYLARLYFRQLFALNNSTSYSGTDINQLEGRSPDKYISITIGKVGAADFFDDNKYSHDPRTQFLCWGLMDNGAWDYPANTRGYTPTALIEYVSIKNELRYGFSLLPLLANGNDMNWNLSNSGSHNLEFTHHYIYKGNEGTIRILGFYNYTKMGDYTQAVSNYTDVPDIISTRNYGRNKFGFAINIEQEINKNLGFFMRASWNDGKNETWAFTEIDRSVSAGISLAGTKWKRKNDTFGLAAVVSGISAQHQLYLKNGGLGFILGDGQLNYAPESLLETYYSCELIRNEIYLSGTYQMLLNPGYNSDRKGPVNVLSLRLHVII